MKSWKRYRGSVLLTYLKKEFSHPLQILWWILCCGDNWDILKTETARYPWGLQQVKKLVYLRLECYFSVKWVIGISSLTSLSRWYVLVFSFISIAPIFVNLFYLIISKRTGPDPWYSKITPSPRHNWIVWLVLKEYFLFAKNDFDVF